LYRSVFVLFAISLIVAGTAICRAEEVGADIVLDGGMETWRNVNPGDSDWDYYNVGAKSWQYTRIESGGLVIPSIWSQQLGDDGILKREDADVHSGKYALRFKGSLYLNMINAEAYNTADGAEYIVKFWVKGSGDTMIHCHVYGEGGPVVQITKTGKPQTDKWTQIEERLTVIGKNSTTIYPRLYSLSEVLVDDISISRVIPDDQFQPVPVSSGDPVRIAMSPGISEPIKIDGRLDEQVWKKAVKFSGMRWVVDQNLLSPKQAYFRVLHDNTNVYFGIELPEPGAVGILDSLKKDRPEHLPDTYVNSHSVELFLQPPGRSAYYMLMYSLDGQRYDGKGHEKDWNGNWEAAVSAGEDGWILEIRLPIGDLNQVSIKPNDDWAFNLCWNRDSNYATWSNVGYDYHNPFAFGRLIMSDYESWAQSTRDAWPVRENEISKQAQAVGLDVSSRLDALKNYAAQISNSKSDGYNWLGITKSYNRVQYVNSGYDSLMKEIEIRSLFGKGNNK